MVPDVRWGEYKNSNIVNPLRAALEFEVFSSDRLALAISASGGMAYVQNIHRLSDKSVNVYSKYTSAYQLGFVLFYRPKWMRGAPKKMLLRAYEVSNDFIDKKWMGSVHAEILPVKLGK